MLSERAPRLEAAVLKIERVNIKLLSNDVGRASYSDLWSIPRTTAYVGGELVNESFGLMRC